MKLLRKIAIFVSIAALAITAVWAVAPESIREIGGPLVAGETESAAPLDPNAPTSLIGPIVKTYAAAKSFRGDLRSLPQVAIQRADRQEMGAPSLGTKITSSGPAVKVQSVAPSAPNASSTFVGLDRATWGAGSPADPNGDVSPTHYIESVNTSVGIFNKSGTRLAAFNFNSFFQAAGVTDACATLNYGDPYVIYDRYSSRWFVSDFAFANSSSGPYYQCIAVSKGSDLVSGGWWAYTFKVSDTQLNDYPKFASWQDGIYMTANLFTGGRNYYGAQATVFNREALVSGAPLTSISFVLPYTATYGYPFSLLASHDASTAATGPEYLYSDWNGLSQWTFTTNWTAPTSSTFSLPRSVGNIPGYASTNGYAPQPGTAQGLDQLGDRLMSAAQWSNASGSPSIWLARTVAANGISGVLWMELRNLGASVSVNQSGVFAPNDGLYRFMPSLAVNAAGTMAVAYSTTSSTSYPSLAYAARTKTATGGTLDLGEGSLFVGSGSQTNLARWGDYYSLSVDPADGCSFWMTGSYMAASGGNWQTRISKFAPQACPAVTTPTATLVTSSGAAGSRITISGTNFMPGATTVLFNGTPSTYIAMASSTSLTAVVPTGATSGSVLVANPAGSVNAGTFTVTTSSPTSVTLTVSKSGAGTVTSAPAGISCGSSCSASFTSGASVTLTAAADSGSQFIGWSGACNGTAATCTLSLTAATSVTAAFRVTTTLTYTGPTTAVRGQTLTLTATLQAGSVLLNGENVTFNLNGKNYVGTTGSTGTTGLASVQAVAPRGKGVYQITVTYSGSTTYASSTTTRSLTVQ